MTFRSIKKMTYRNFKVYKGWHVRTLNYANSLQRNTKVCKEWHIKGFEICKKMTHRHTKVCKS